MKNPENMTADERLKRIRSLERKVRVVENERDWARRETDSIERWAQEAWTEIRRLHDVLEQHWEVRQEARLLAGLDREDRTELVATFDYDTREWVPVAPNDRATMAKGEGT